MTDTPADLQTLFDAEVARIGADRCSAADTEIIGIIVRLLVAIRTADPPEVPKIASTITQLQATLPAPAAADTGKPWDLSKLNGAELAELERMCAVATGEALPTPEPIEPEREPQASEVEGQRLGRWIDERCEQWTHRQLSESEQIELRNSFQHMTRGFFIARDLWSSIYRADMETEIRRAVAAALRAVNSDATVVPMTADEKARQLEAPKPLPPASVLAPARDSGDVVGQVNATNPALPPPDGWPYR